MTFSEYVKAYAGKTVDTDNSFGGQCMDNMHQYCKDVLGLSYKELAAPAAKDVFLQFDTRVGHELFDKITNTPTGIPKSGDIVLWGTGIGPYGHVAIFQEGDENKFISFDQNWNNVQKCESITHNYNSVLGWLRLKEVTTDCSECEYEVEDPEDGKVKSKSGQWFATEWVNEKTASRKYRDAVTALNDKYEASQRELTEQTKRSEEAISEALSCSQEMVSLKAEYESLNEDYASLQSSGGVVLSRISNQELRKEIIRRIFS